MKKILFLFILLSSFTSKAQLNIQHVSEDQYPTIFNLLFWDDVGISGLTPLADKLGRHFLYVASNEEGLRIYNTDPVLNLVTSINTTELHSVCSTVSQRDTILYVGSGTLFGNLNDTVGLVTVNVADPSNPVILDKWFDPNKTPGIPSGTGVIRVQGEYAFIGGMAEGLIILNISDPSNISFVSKLTPPITFPFPGNQQSKVNARGMAVVDSLVYMCYDAGGIRVINCADISNPVQIGEFANDITYASGNQPRAYNNLVVNDTLLYAAADYCGLEIWNISDPSNAQLLTHWNPSGCPGPTWWGAAIHTNELIYQPACDLLFISTGKSDMMVVDVADPLMPVAIDSFGTTTDTTATWGVDITDDRIYLSYVFIHDSTPPVLAPFYSNWSGIKQLSYTTCNVDLVELENQKVQIYPNPTEDVVTVSIDGSSSSSVVIYSLQGQKITEDVGNTFMFDTSSWDSGMYVVRIESEGQIYTEKLMVGK